MSGYPPTITELCLAVGSKERTLRLSCVEAFGRLPAALLAALYRGDNRRHSSFDGKYQTRGTEGGCQRRKVTKANC
jgi:hypothetical protein